MKNAIIALAAITGIIHLVLGFQIPDELFILNGIGFFGLTALLYFVPQAAQYRTIIHYALIVYTIITIIAYFAFQGVGGFSSPVGMLTKLVEVVLAGLLIATRPK